MRKTLSTIMLLAASTLLLAACGGGGNDDTSGKDSSSSEVPTLPDNLANGAFEYVSASGAERTEILGALEKYAVDTHLTGLTFMGNGGYVMYQTNVQKGTNTYIPGYGFGILGEGDITGDLAGETNNAWKRYYHTYEVEDPGMINYMDNQGSVVGDLMGYTASSYFDTFMSSTKDSYNWVAGTSLVDRPIALNPNTGEFDASYKGTSKTFRFPVRVGSQLKYSTNSETFAEFNGREVELEDYITAYKIYFTQAYGLKRSSENLDKNSSIAGARAYYEASKDGFNEEAWKNIGISAYEEAGQSFLQFTFNGSCTPFYAMYYLAGGMFQPVPAEFIEAIGDGDFTQGVKNWGKYDTGKTLSPKDTWLSTGPYTIERWDTNQQIVFKKNPYYFDDAHYKIGGVHINILTAAATNAEAAFNEFLNNKLSAVGIPKSKLAEYRTDPRTTQTASSSNFKLNINTCDQETWEGLFGVDGSVMQTPVSEYYQCKPIMNNDDFIDGISYAINRIELATNAGVTPAFEYFADTYLIDPENGVSYNSTDAHRAAVADQVAGTDGYGYSLELAKQSFKKAADTLVEQGKYTAGQTVQVDIVWMSQTNITNYGDAIEGYIENAFNASGATFRLDINNYYPSTNYMDCYYKMMEGQFDIGFGSISGNEYDPLNFFEVLKSDNSSGFTLNWGTNTNVIDPYHLIEYDNKTWSFDALWTAADHGAYVEDGCNSPLCKLLSIAVTRETDGGLTVAFRAKETIIDEDTFGFVFAFCLYAYTDDVNYSDYYEEYVYFDEEVAEEDNGRFFVLDDDGAYTYTFEAEFVEEWLEIYPAEELAGQGLDFYFANYLLGSGNVSFAGTYWQGYIPAIPVA